MVVKEEKSKSTGKIPEISEVFYPKYFKVFQKYFFIYRKTEKLNDIMIIKLTNSRRLSHVKDDFF